MAQEWNPSGYLWNVVPHVDVQVGMPAAATSTSNEPVRAVTHPPNFRATCLGCHDDGLILQQRLTRAQWERELNKMIDWGAKVAPEDRGPLLDYLQSLRQ
jgi:hypothetical protein